MAHELAIVCLKRVSSFAFTRDTVAVLAAALLPVCQAELCLAHSARPQYTNDIGTALVLIHWQEIAGLTQLTPPPDEGIRICLRRLSQLDTISVRHH